MRYESFNWGQGSRGGRYWLPQGKQDTPENRLYGQEAEAAARAAMQAHRGAPGASGRNQTATAQIPKQAREAMPLAEGMGTLGKAAVQAIGNPKKAASVATKGANAGRRLQRAASSALADLGRKARESGELADDRLRQGMLSGVDRALGGMDGPMKTLAKKGLLKAVSATSPKAAKQAIQETSRGLAGRILRMGRNGIMKAMRGLVGGAGKVVSWATRKTWLGRAGRHLPQAAAWGLGAIALTTTFAVLPAILGSALTAGLVGSSFALLGAGTGAVISMGLTRKWAKNPKERGWKAMLVSGLMGAGVGAMTGAIGSLGALPGMVLGMWALAKTGLKQKTERKAAEELALSMPWVKLKKSDQISEAELRRRRIIT